MKGYKTFVTNGILALLSGIELATNQEIAVDDQTAIIAGTLAVINIILRFVTKTPIFRKA